MAVNTVKLQVDGATLLKLTTEGWRELAAPDEVSCIAVAKVMTEIERLAGEKTIKLESQDEGLVRPYFDSQDKQRNRRAFYEDK